MLVVTAAAPGLQPFRSARRTREATAVFRRMPDFVIIGAAKAGTTSLFRYLSAHPRVSPPGRKELHYFDSDAEPAGRLRYRAWFPLLDVRHRTLTFESTPGLLWLPQSPTRVRDTVPRAKLIALLRQPVERAFSQYRMVVEGGHEDLSFEEAIGREEERLAAAPVPSSPRGVRHLASRYWSYKARGRYVEQLERWFAVFPREQFLILRSEDLFEDPGTTYRRVLEFLGLDPSFVPTFEIHRQGRPASFDPALAEKLRAQLAAANHGLRELAGIDPETWTTVTSWGELVSAPAPAD
jgi:hypothetical protein